MEAELKTETASIIDKAKISEAAGASSFMNPEPKTAKKGPGRPKKASEPKKEEDKKQDDTKPLIETKALCYPIVKIVSVAGVNYTKDARAALTPQEADGMAEALGLVLDKYMPDAMKNYGPEIALTLCMGQYGLRLYAIKKLQEEKLQKENAASQQNARPQEEVKNDLGNLESSLVF